MTSDHPLLGRLRALALPAGEYAVFGSGPLLVRGLIDDAGDLDVIVRDRAWEAAAAHGSVVRLEGYDVEVVDIDDGRLTFGRTWAIGDFDVDHLIETAEVIAGLPFVRLEHVAAYKRIADRDKDRVHLEAMGAARASE